MNEAIRGDVLTKKEMKQRRIVMVDGTRGGLELHAPTYQDLIATVLQRRGFLEDRELNAACDYLELKNSVYGFLNVKTMAGILQAGEAGFKREHAEDAYYIATRYIGKTNDSVITRAMNEKADATLDMIMVINAYIVSFRVVFDGMDLAIRTIKDNMQKELA